MQEVFEKIIEKLEELKQKEKNRPDDCDENGYGDGEQIYEDGRSQGRYEQTVKIIEIIQQAAEELSELRIKMCNEKDPERLMFIMPVLNCLIGEAQEYKEWIKEKLKEFKESGD